jgi:hypothetical protein
LFAKLESGDIVIAAKLDRLFRSALDALKVVESLKTRGVKLHLLDLGGDWRAADRGCDRRPGPLPNFHRRIGVTFLAPHHKAK